MRSLQFTLLSGAHMFYINFCCLLYLMITNTVFAYGKTVPGNISSGIYTYQENVGKKSIPFYWKVEEKNPFITVSVFEENKSFINFCSVDGATLQWKLKVKNKYDIIADRVGNSLTISGTKNGKTYNKTIKIDERPWYQPLSFSFRSFLSSQKDSMSFWVIRADNIDVIALTVKKQEDDMIVFNDTPYDAHKVEVRAEGILSPFWHGTYWFRKSDKLFLKYQSVHGPPGTDETTVKLMKLPD